MHKNRIIGIVLCFLMFVAILVVVILTTFGAFKTAESNNSNEIAASDDNDFVDTDAMIQSLNGYCDCSSGTTSSNYTYYRLDGLTGLHYDVEPHTLDEWDDNWMNVGEEYLDLLVSLRQILSNTHLTLNLDINCDLDGAQCKEPASDTCDMTYNNKTQSLAAHIIEVLDGRLNLMAYFSSIDEMITRTENEYTLCVEKGIDAVIAVNLRFTSSDFFFNTTESMETSLSSFQAAYPVTPVPNRFAIHHYGYYQYHDPEPPISGSQRDYYWWCSTSSTDVDGCNIYDEEHRAQVLAFMELYDGDTLYMDAPAIVNLTPPYGDQELLCDFIKELHAAGIKTQLIFGSHDWALSENHNIPIEYAANVIRMIEYYGDEYHIEQGEQCTCL